MSAERWLPVVGWEGIYEVSDLGSVKRIRFGKGVRNFGQPMKWHHDRHGYPCVNLCDRGRNRFVKVHRLVGDAFLGPIPEGMETRHLNGDPGDPRLVNLAYGTHAENMRDMVEHGRSRLALTHCPKGHPYDEANTYIDHRGARNCRICRAAWESAGERRRKAERRERGEDYFYEVRRWGRENGYRVADTGRISNELLNAYRAEARELSAA